MHNLILLTFHQCGLFLRYRTAIDETAEGIQRIYSTNTNDLQTHMASWRESTCCVGTRTSRQNKALRVHHISPLNSALYQNIMWTMAFELTEQRVPKLDFNVSVNYKQLETGSPDNTESVTSFCNSFPGSSYTYLQRNKIVQRLAFQFSYCLT